MDPKELDDQRHVKAVSKRPRGRGLSLVSISAERKLTLTLVAQLKFLLSPVDVSRTKITRGCVPEVLKLSSNVSDVSRRSSR